MTIKEQDIILKQRDFNDEQVEFLECYGCEEDFPCETPEDIAIRAIDWLTGQYRIALSIIEK